MYAQRCSSKIFRSESGRYSLKTLQEVVNRYCDQAWHMLVHFGTNPFGGFLEELYTLWLPKGSHGPNDHFNSRPSFPSSAFSRRLDVIFGLSPEMCAGRCHMRLRLAKAGSWMEQLGDFRGTALDHLEPQKDGTNENGSILVNQINLYIYR